MIRKGLCTRNFMIISNLTKSKSCSMELLLMSVVSGLPVRSRNYMIKLRNNSVIINLNLINVLLDQKLASNDSSCKEYRLPIIGSCLRLKYIPRSTRNNILNSLMGKGSVDKTFDVADHNLNSPGFEFLKLFLSMLENFSK